MERKGISINLIALISILLLLVIIIGVSIAANKGLFKSTKDGIVDIGKEQNKIKEGTVVDDKTKDRIPYWERNVDDLSYIDESGTKHENVLKIGDIVDYTPKGGKNSTLLSKDKSGFEKDQTIVKNDSIWIVLGIKDQNSDGINETLLLTTEKPIEEKFYFERSSSI